MIEAILFSISVVLIFKLVITEMNYKEMNKVCDRIDYLLIYNKNVFRDLRLCPENSYIIIELLMADFEKTERELKNLNDWMKVNHQVDYVNNKKQNKD